MLRWIGLMTLGALAMWAPSAQATSNYFGALNGYAYPENPDGKCGWSGTCMLCHLDNPGSKGTVKQPFGAALMTEFGLVGNTMINDPLLAALDQAKLAGLDADDDGVPDIDELCGGGEPNKPGVGLGGLPPAVEPEFGCIATMAGNVRQANSGLLSITLLTCGVLALRRRPREVPKTDRN